ncbi:MAG: hypothetical protein ACKPBF_09135, partial [Actinomycetota bacterium]
ATADPPNVAVGLLNPNAASPKVFVEILNPPSVGVAFPTVTVIVMVPPETKLVVLLGVNVPVIVAEPALPKSSWVLLAAICTTAVALDTYVHEPVADVVATVGAVMLAFASPYVADTFDHVNVGVALSIVNVAVAEVAL